MPRKVWETEQDFRDTYEIGIRDPKHPQHGQTVTYGRLFAQRAMGPLDDELTLYNNRVNQLLRLFLIGQADRVLVVGCGFGFLIDAFHDAGFPNTWGIESSEYIQENQEREARTTTQFVDSDIRDWNQARFKLREMTGDWIFNWIITESVMESYEDVEMDLLLDSVEALLDGNNGLRNAIHLVAADPTLDPAFNVKTLPEWKAVRPQHSWVDAATWEIG